MKFEIGMNLKGIEVQGEELEYIFTTKLFSHSSKLIDMNSNIIASLSRSNWWRMDFNLAINDKDYQLKQRVSETTLCLKNSEAFHYTSSGMSFYEKSKPVSQVTAKGLKKFSLEIYNEDHWLALLVATCLKCYDVKVNG